MPTLPFSIIIPIYNDESNLPRCLDSIISQTFTDFECLLIDDGSTDNCPAICDAYAEKDSRFRVFHKKNECISKTRQFGINISTGEYTIFLDSDDWIEPDFISGVIQKINISKSDVIFMDFHNEIAPEKKRYVTYKICTDNLETTIRQVLEGKILSCLWNVIINRNFYFQKKIKFTEGINYGEDSLFIIELLLNNPSIDYLPKAYYHHIINEYSYTNKDKRARYCERINFHNELSVLLDNYSRNDLKDFNFFPLNDKYRVLSERVFSKKEFQALYPYPVTSYYRKNASFIKYILLFFSQTPLYFLAKFIAVLIKQLIKLLPNFIRLY